MERGDRVPNGSRVVPLTATLTFDLTAPTPSVVGLLHDAVLEGGVPFELTVHSSTGGLLANGTYRFEGGYLGDSSQYRFDWRFSADNNGTIFWNGYNYWAGGHLWQVEIRDVVLIPEPSVLALALAAAVILSIRSHS